MTEKNIDHIIILISSCLPMIFYLFLNRQRNKRPAQQNPNPNEQIIKPKASWVEYMYWLAGIGLFLITVYQLFSK